MKFGVISDVHGNIVALEKVLNEFEKRNVEKIICCGDIIGIGPRPEEALQKIKELGDKVICVRGNHEGYLLDGIPKIIHNRPMTEEETAFHQWTQSTLSDNTKEFIEKLPYEEWIEVDDKKIYIAHYPYDENMEFKRHIFKPSLEECKELFSKIEADVYLFGHTHFKVENSDILKKYINPGPLGCPGTEQIANCGLLEIENDKIEYEQLEVNYDTKQVIDDINELKYPYYRGILRDFFGVKDDI